MSAPLGELTTMPRTTLAKNWVFTWNNYPEDYRVIITEKLEQDGIDLVYLSTGEEVGESGTPHLQGFLALSTAITKPSEKLWQAHWERAKHFQHAIDYTQKGSQTHTEWSRLKTKGPHYGEDAVVFTLGERPLCSTQGKRSDLEDFRDSVRDAFANGEFFSTKRARLEHTEIAAKYPGFVRAIINDYSPQASIPLHPLYPWQQHLNQVLNGPADDRTIHFVVDIRGNSGKSWFAKYYSRNHEYVQIIKPGRAADMGFEVECSTRVFFIDCPRQKVAHFNYFVLEDMKDKCVSSPKYESCTKELWHDHVHVVVLMNQEPDRTIFSEDRYEIIHTPHDPSSNYLNYTSAV